MSEENGTEIADSLLAAVADSFRSNAVMYRDIGSPLYGELFARAADDPALVELASHSRAGARPVHLLSAVHDLLLRDPSDPLSRYFATLSNEPAPPEQAYPELQRFCRERRGEILPMLRERTVQSTYVERCWALTPALAVVADRAGEPLDLIEIGCSAGVLLTFDRYAYDIEGIGRIGPEDAPLTLTGRYTGRPPWRIPEIGARFGLDLHPLDAASVDDRHWLQALCIPELRDEQARLATALDVVAQADMKLLEGDALDLLPGALDSVQGPVCVFHSVCLLYWSDEAKAALDRQLREASRSRAIHRLGFELSNEFDAYHAGRGDAPDAPQRPAGATFDITFTHYSDGEAESRVLAHATPDFTSVYWLN